MKRDASASYPRTRSQGFFMFILSTPVAAESVFVMLKKRVTKSTVFRGFYQAFGDSDAVGGKPAGRLLFVVRDLPGRNI